VIFGLHNAQTEVEHKIPSRRHYGQTGSKIKSQVNKKLMVLTLVRHRSIILLQIVLGLQTIISRNLNIAETGAVISVGKLMLEYS
jgi:hypothetical protein